MPRDFVPCAYHEWETQDIVTQTWHRRYEAMEAFAVSDSETREPLLIVNGDSHVFHVGVTESALDRLLWPTLGQRYDAQRHIDRKARTELFRTFYAAMAALE